MINHQLRNKLKKFSFCLLLPLSACGGGSGGDAATAVQTQATPAVVSEQWQEGVYTPQSNHIAKCENPRTGIDPFTGSSYPDTQGTSLDEKLWLRAFTYETYLWFDEVPDNDPELFSVPAYFDQLKTTELTDSGNIKDNFHFSSPTEQENQRSQGGVISGYGFNWEFDRFSPPRALIVRYVETGSPADEAGVKRGMRLLKINDIDFVNSRSSSDIESIRTILFPRVVGEPHSFTFVSPDNQEQTFILSSDNNIQLSGVQNTKVLQTNSGRVGYMQFNTFNQNAQADLITAFTEFNEQAIDELVIDLRYNGGGLLILSSQLAYMIAGQENTQGKVYYQSRQNSKIAPSPSPPLDFVSLEIDYEQRLFRNRVLPSANLNRVYILSTDNTCSASEAVINGLKGIDIEVVLIGGRTCGKPYGFIPQDNCGTTYFTIQSQGVNAKGFGEYVNGFVPTQVPAFDDDVLGCSVPDDLNHLLGSPDEAMLSAALEHIQMGICPAQIVAGYRIEQLELELKGEMPFTIPNYDQGVLIDDRYRFAQ